MQYNSAVTDAEWNLISFCFPKPNKKGRPREHTYRELLDAICYLNKTGCQWRYLPKDFPRWQTAYHYFRLWKNDGTWLNIHTHLREAVRLLDGRKRDPSAGIIDSQSVKSTECSDERGYDAGKKVNGRKRHVLTDTIGLILLVMVLPANIQDRDGAKQLLAAFFANSPLRRVKHIWADGGYAGALVELARKLWNCTIEVVKRPELHKFIVMPRRWVVERTFGWLGRYRRLNRDYERQAKTGETMVYLAMIRLMLRRITAA
jgi:putative transposase